MIKGCKKNVVWLRSTGNEMFEEAYFILSDKKENSKACETDMLKAASKLIAESPVAGYFGEEPAKKTEKHHQGISNAVFFLLGALTMAAFNALIIFII